MTQVFNPTTFQVFLWTAQEHLKQAGFHSPYACGDFIRCPKCSELCLEPSDMSPALLNALRMAVVAVQLRSADRLRETFAKINGIGSMFMKINGIGSMFNEEELAALASGAMFADDLHPPAYARVDADSGVDEHDDGVIRPNRDVDQVGQPPEPPTERGRVGSGIFFPSDTVRAMMKCDCAECPNGCRECQKKE